MTNPLYEFSVLLGAMALAAAILVIAFFGTAFIGAHAFHMFKQTIMDLANQAKSKAVKPVTPKVTQEEPKPTTNKVKEKVKDSLRTPAPILSIEVDDNELHVPTYLRKGVILDVEVQEEAPEGHQHSEADETKLTHQSSKRARREARKMKRMQDNTFNVFDNSQGFA